MMDRPADITLILPVPPSVNRIWRSVGGRVLKDAGYRAWSSEAGWLIQTQRAGDCIPGGYLLKLTMPSSRGDLDNYIKPISDILQKQGVVRDDKHAAEIWLTRDHLRDPKTCVVELWATSDKPPRKERRKGPARLRMAVPVEPVNRA